jgi:L-cysteine desulfidase
MECDECLSEVVSSEVMPSAGCTEIASIALGVALAAHGSGEPYRVRIYVDEGTFKNAVSAGVPGGGSGIEEAVRRAITSEPRGLQTLAFSRKRYEGPLDLVVYPLKMEDIFIYVTTNGEASLISSKHDRVAYVGPSFSSIGEAIEYTRQNRGDIPLERLFQNGRPIIGFEDVLAYAESLSSSRRLMELVHESSRIDMALAEDGLRKNYRGYSGSLPEGSPRERAIKLASAAVEARMSGSLLPAMAVAGSGNQGITSTLPIYVYGKEKGYDDEIITASVMVSWLTTIYTTGYLGYISPFCSVGLKGGAGLAAGLAYMLSSRDIGAAMRAAINHIISLGGVFCDGAKPSCSLKTSTGVETAFRAANLAAAGRTVLKNEGLSGSDLDEVLENYRSIENASIGLINESLVRVFARKLPYVDLSLYHAASGPHRTASG